MRSLLGKGGMGEVYEAYDTGKDRLVALKLLVPELAQDPAYQVRFRRESQAAAKLAEPHVIPIHDWGVIDGVLFIDMRLVPGTDLRTVLRAGGPLNPDRAVAVVEQIAAALDAAHAGGLVHRDVKPANILVTPADFAYLADFGIAHTEGDSAVTQAGMAMGSYIYMAPERFDVGPISHRADVYSLACVLHECLTGATPFPAASMSVLIRAHLSEAPPRPSTLVPGIPPSLDEVIAIGMAKDPAERYPSAGALAVAARDALAAVVHGAVPPAGAVRGPAGGPGQGREAAATGLGVPGPAQGTPGGPNPRMAGAHSESAAAVTGYPGPAPTGERALPGSAGGRSMPGGAVAGGAGAAGAAGFAGPGSTGERGLPGAVGGRAVPGGQSAGGRGGSGGGRGDSGAAQAGERAVSGVRNAGGVVAGGGRDVDGAGAAKDNDAAPTPTGEFRVVGAVTATGGIETSRSQSAATGAQPTLIIRPPANPGPETAGFTRVPAEGTGEISVPAVIQPTGPTEIRPDDVHFTPLPPADAPAAPQPRPAYTPDQGLPKMRPFPDAHLYDNATQGETSSPVPHSAPFPAPTGFGPPPPAGPLQQRSAPTEHRPGGYHGPAAYVDSGRSNPTPRFGPGADGPDSPGGSGPVPLVGGTPEAGSGPVPLPPRPAHGGPGQLPPRSAPTERYGGDPQSPAGFPDSGRSNPNPRFGPAAPHEFPDDGSVPPRPVFADAGDAHGPATEYLDTGRSNPNPRFAGEPPVDPGGFGAPTEYFEARPPFGPDDREPAPGDPFAAGRNARFASPAGDVDGAGSAGHGDLPGRAGPTRKFDGLPVAGGEAGGAARLPGPDDGFVAPAAPFGAGEFAGPTEQYTDLPPNADDPQRYAATQHYGAGPNAPATERYDQAGFDAHRSAPTRQFGDDPDPQRAQATRQYRGGAAPFPAHHAPPEDPAPHYEAYAQYDDANDAYGDHAYRDPAYGADPYGPEPGYADPAWQHQEPRRNRSLLPILVGVLAVVVLAIGGAIGWRLMSGGDEAPATTAAPTSAPAGGGVAPTTAPRPTTAAPTTTAGPVILPASARPCESAATGGMFSQAAIGTTVTSCGFAEAVRAAYAAGGESSGPRSVVAASPVTGRTYTMTCTPDGALVTCTGGENAVVYVY
ncbi:serine/threonine-protein kinase [Nocardia rhizosphaerae]|uniref:non-specific serine/threonine protein kinase n=1 Tax=Nocardia rhizosphaerae TaxID=1691571 RepID=A0ABV8L6A5_9NOCA